MVAHVHLNNPFWPIETNSNGLSGLSNSHVSRDRKCFNFLNTTSSFCVILGVALSDRKQNI